MLDLDERKSRSVNNTSAFSKGLEKVFARSHEMREYNLYWCKCQYQLVYPVMTALANSAQEQGAWFKEKPPRRLKFHYSNSWSCCCKVSKRDPLKMTCMGGVPAVQKENQSRARYYHWTYRERKLWTLINFAGQIDWTWSFSCSHGCQNNVKPSKDLFSKKMNVKNYGKAKFPFWNLKQKTLELKEGWGWLFSPTSYIKSADNSV